TFPITPLPENSKITVTFGTNNNQAPENVTISVIACYTPTTATTIVTSSSHPPTVSGSTPALAISSTSAGVTKGMDSPQYINNPIIIGASSLTSPSEINPGSDGVDFKEKNSSVIIPFAPGITPILASIAVPNKNTNVNNITVTITEASGKILVKQVSPGNTNKVDTFPITPLPENSKITVTFGTNNNQAPENVTISVIACYTPTTATTIVTSSSHPPTVSGSTPALAISSTSAGVTQGTEYTSTITSGHTTPVISSSFASTPLYTFTTPSTGSTPSMTSHVSTEETQKKTEPLTTTMICPLKEGMDSPQYINNPIIIGASSLTSPSEINPGSDGVDFKEKNSSVIIPFAPGITPILASIAVPNKNTNVNNITVTITEASGKILVKQVSPGNTNKVDTFPITPLPENSKITVTFGTNNNQAPENVTISVIACYTPTTATTIVTSSSHPPTVSGSTPALAISSTSAGVTQGTEYTCNTMLGET
ncbi:unnamed protein product, partial [Rotaria sordida]